MVVSAVELAARRSSTKAAPNSYAATQARMQAQLDATAGNLVTYHAPGRTRSKKAKEHVAGFRGAVIFQSTRGGDVAVSRILHAVWTIDAYHHVASPAERTARYLPRYLRNALRNSPLSRASN